MLWHQFFNLTFEFICLVTGFLFVKYLDENFKILLAFVVFAFITELTLYVTIKTWNLDNRPLLHFYVPIEFMFLALFYLKQFTGFINKKVFITLMVVFVSYCIINMSFIQSLHEYANTRSVEALIFVVFSIIYFYKVMIETKVRKLANEPMIWVNTGVLLYFSGSFFFHILFNVVLKNSISFAKIITNIFAVLNLLFYFLIMIGFVKKRLYSKKIS